MVITWYGQSCFKIETRGATIAVDPFGKEIGLATPRFRGDLLLVTHGHASHANVRAIPGDPAVIAGPGEYELRGIEIRGIPTYHDSRQGRDRGPNTAYLIIADGLKLLHLGDYGEEVLRPEVREAMGAIDLLLVPVGGHDTIGPGEASRLIHQLEPAMVVPMHYQIPGLLRRLEPLESFLKELGVRRPEPLPKLTVKKRDLPAQAAKIQVLMPAGLLPSSHPVERQAA